MLFLVAQILGPKQRIGKCEKDFSPEYRVHINAIYACKAGKAQALTINMCELGLGFISTLLLLSGSQEDIWGAQHSGNGNDLVGTTAGSTPGPNQVPAQSLSKIQITCICALMQGCQQLVCSCDCLLSTWAGPCCIKPYCCDLLLWLPWLIRMTSLVPQSQVLALQLPAGLLLLLSGKRCDASG